MHELNEALGRHGGRNGSKKCNLCGAKCANVVYVLCLFSQC